MPQTESPKGPLAEGEVRIVVRRNDRLPGLWFSSLSELQEWAAGASGEIQRIRYRARMDIAVEYWESFGSRPGELGTQVKHSGFEVDIQASDIAMLVFGLEILADYYRTPRVAG